MTLTATHKR